MISIAHVINPVAVKPTSDLAIAQPVTFESMRIAHEFAATSMKVELLAAIYSEDESMVPAWCTKLPLMERSILDVGKFQVPRKLPLIRDILDRAAEATNADYLIYTNADIALMPSFYVSVANLLSTIGGSISITRRTIPKTHTSSSDLPWMYAQLGEQHPGNDCFIFPRRIHREFDLGQTCIGAGHFARMLLLNMMAHADFQVFRDLHLTFHLGDDQTWKDDRLSDYIEHQRAEFYAVLRKYRDAGKLPDNEFTRRWLKREQQAGRRQGRDRDE